MKMAQWGDMARWSNFAVWRGRLPHWRADDVTYFVTFRHRRALTEDERADLFSALVKPQGRKWDIDVVCVLEEKTELLARVERRNEGGFYELSDVVEKAKAKAGKAIVKRSGERFPPFYSESFDRIMRDEAETGATWEQIVAAPVNAGLVEDAEEYRFLWVAVAP